MLDEAAYFLLGNIKIYYYGLHIALGALAAVIVLALWLVAWLLTERTLLSSIPT